MKEKEFYSYNNIITSLPQKKNSNSSLWVKVLIRKISFLFTFVFINLGFSANAVSVLSIVVALIGCVFFLIPISGYSLWGVILINFWLVLDCVDGNIARCKKQKTVYGEFVDDIGGYYIEAFVYFTIGVCSFYKGGIIIDKESLIILIIGAISSIINILSRLIYKDYCYYSTKASSEMQEEKTRDDRKSLYYIRNRVSKEIGMSGVFMPLLFICEFLNCYDILSVFYFLFNGFALLSTSVIYIYKADKYDKNHLV